MKRIIVSILVVFSTVNVCSADILKTHDFTTMQQIVLNADHDTLVIFDVDDVLVQPADQIFQSRNKQYLLQLDKELSSRVPPYKLEYIRSKIAFKQQEKLVDARILELLTNLRQNKINTVALTNCATGQVGKISKFEDWRVTRLAKLGIDFSAHNTLPDIYIDSVTPVEGKPTIKSGIVFTGYADKGAVLEAVLNKFSMRPKRIIFIDDKLQNLKSVEAVARQYNIEFVGVEYCVVKTLQTEELNTERAKYQFLVLEREHYWLSDHEAEERMSLER